MIKKYYINLLALAIISIGTMQFAQAQATKQSSQIYKISIESVGQQLVKPLIGLLMPIFNQVPFIEADKYNNYYYEYLGDLDVSLVEDLLQNSKYVLLDISVLNDKAYSKMIKHSLNPKN